MNGWNAITVNDPLNDYDLMIEIQYENSDVGCIKKTTDGLELLWYSNSSNLTIPLAWLENVIQKAKKEL